MKLTPAANPGADAVAELIYSSTRLQPDGLISQIDPSQVIPVTDSVNGDAFDFSQMDALVVQLGGLWDPAACAWLISERVRWFFSAVISTERSFMFSASSGVSSRASQTFAKR